MDKTNPFISVVIATLNRTDFLIRCIKSIIYGDYANFEIIVVDQGRDGKTKMEINERFGNEKRLRYYNADIVGLSYARNFGYERARGKIIAYIDDDTTASPGWLKAYANAFTEIKPAPAMAGGKILPDWGIPCPPWYPEDRKFILGLYDIGDKVRRYPEHHLPPGTNFAMLREVIDKIGGFDRRLGFNEGRKNSMMAGEDSLMAIKVKNAGYSIYYYPEASVFHYIGSNKLTKKYFLRRHFWEGITVVNIAKISGCISRSKLLTILIYNSATAFWRGIASIINILKRTSDSRTRQMLNLGLMFYSLGVLFESTKLLCKGVISREHRLFISKV